MERPFAGLQIRLFGHAGAAAGGVPVRFAKRATTLSLLAYLILKDGTPVSRSTLAYTLFADEPEENALAELRRYLYLAAKALPPSSAPWIAADADTVRWTGGDGCFVDVVEFGRLASDPAGYAQAVDLYAGDLLEDVYDDWAIERRESFRARYLDLLAHLVASCRRSRDHSQAIAYAQRLLAADPWREDVLRALMAVRYATGDSAGALAEYARFTRRLHDEMHEIPMPETTAVRDAIRANAPLPGEPADREREPQARREDRPLLAFAGRAAELERLQALWRRAARGHGNAVLVAGEGGIGKTRLCSELSHIVQSEGGRVFAGGTSAPESIPYQCVVEALRSAIALLGPKSALAPARATTLARVLPELRDAESAEPLPPGDAEGEDARLLEAIADAAAALARPRPLLLILEDLHWAGRATLEAFARLARRAENAPVLLVATCRDEATGPSHALRALVRELRAEQRLATLDLARLERSDVETILAAFQTLPELGEHAADRLYRHTEGNPLFLSETLADLAERRGAAPPGAESVAEGIARIIAARTAELGEEARTVAEVAAVAGYGCTAELVRDVTALSPGALSAAFNELLDRRILREAGTRYDGDYAFTHHLIAAAVYAAVDPATRKRRHARIAHVLETSSDQRIGTLAGELARHYDAADLSQQAARWYAAAAHESAAVFALDEAIGFATRALALETGRSARAELLRQRETWRGRRGLRDGQREDLDALEALLTEADERERFDLLRRRMLLARSLGEADGELALIDAMAAVAERAGDERLRAETLLQRAAFAVSLSRHAVAREPAVAALARFEALGDGAAQIACLSLLVEIAANAGDDDATRGYLETLRERASTQADRAVEAQALRVAAQAALLSQRYAECRDLTRRVLPLVQRLGDLDAEALAHVRIAVTSAWLEDFEQAEDGFDRAVEILETTGNKRALAIALTNRVLVEMRIARFEQAQALIERSNRLFETVRERRTVVANANNLSFIRHQLGDADGALRWAREAHDGARAIAFPVFEAAALSNLGNAERAAGRFSDAIAHMEEGIALRRAHQAPGDYADDLADLCAAYAQAGRPLDALRCAREIEEIARAPLAGAFWPHYVLYCASAGFAAGGEANKAREFLARALAELQRFAAAIADPVKRAGFLAARANAEIARARHAGAIPSNPL